MNTPATPHSRFLPFMLLSMLALVWGSSFILMKRSLVVFSPLQVAALRVIFAALMLAPFLPRSLKSLEPQHWKYLIAAGVLGNGLPAIFFTTAQRHINSSTAALLNSLTPLFTLLIGVVIFHLQAQKRQVAGVVMGFVGATALVLAARGEIGAREGGSLWFAALPILATMCYGLNMNIVSRHLKGLTPIAISTIALWVLLVMYTPALLATGFIAELPTLQAHPQFWQAIGCLLFLASFGTAISNALHTRLIQISSPVFASSVTYLIPIVALGWGLLDGELLTMLHFIGIATILIGIYLVNKRS
jgi:drug/metabolite transporter (DMT)-like permease